MDDIIEIGDDGIFEIPSPTRIPITFDTDQNENDFIESNSPSFSIPEPPDTYLKKIIDTLQPGEYKILESSNDNMIVVILMLFEGEIVENCKAFKSHVEISTNKIRKLSVDIPECNIYSATSASYNNIIYIQIKK